MSTVKTAIRTFATLPKQLYIVGKRNADGTGKLKTCAATTGRIGLYVWTALKGAQQFSAEVQDQNAVMEIDRDFHALMWIDEGAMHFWLIDRQPRDQVLDTGAPISVEKLCRYDCIVLADDRTRVTAIESSSLRLGASVEHTRAVVAEAIASPTLPYLELLERVKNRLCQKPSEPYKEELQPTLGSKCEANASPLAGKGPDAKFIITYSAELEEKVLPLVPPTPCRRCGETTWTHLELSANQTAAKWQCDFCGAKRIVRADERSASDAGHERQALPRSVQHEVWRRDRGQCVKCGSREKLEFDHIVPLSRGGSNTTRNIQLLCEPCNRAKGNRIG